VARLAIEEGPDLGGLLRGRGRIAGGVGVRVDCGADREQDGERGGDRTPDAIHAPERT
jgi:hypothetical protein